MIGIAVVCTILGGILGAFLEPVSLSISIPIAIMGGFIMKEIPPRYFNGIKKHYYGI